MSLAGVFGAGWPIGTAIALYWAENVLRGGIVLLQLAVARRRGGRDAEAERRVFLLAVLFNAAHAVFLLVILGRIVPRVAPRHRFDRGSFEEGLLLIAVFLAIELIAWLLSAKDTAGARRAADLYTRRVVVVHFAIVAGMFGIVLLNQVTLFFLAFAALKTFSDVWTARLRTS